MGGLLSSTAASRRLSKSLAIVCEPGGKLIDVFHSGRDVWMELPWPEERNFNGIRADDRCGRGHVDVVRLRNSRPRRSGQCDGHTARPRYLPGIQIPAHSPDSRFLTRDKYCHNGGNGARSHQRAAPARKDP